MRIRRRQFPSRVASLFRRFAVARVALLAAGAFAATASFPSIARAQQPATLPPLPGSAPDEALPPPPPPPPPSATEPPLLLGPASPPPLAPVRPRGKHAPRYSLWTGARFGFLGFGGGFYGITVGNSSTTEWTTQIVKPGPTLEADVGVRLGRRFIPFIFYERAVLGPGERFTGDSGATAYSELYGLGLRFTAGDVNTAGFLTEISIGERNVGVNANGQSYRMSGFEYFKLGLGAEIRISSLLVLSPLASLSTGTLTGTSGSVTFSSQGSRDGVTQPPYENGASIQDQRGYVMLSLTCGAHFDLLGD
jgi:hypothetical protein